MKSHIISRRNHFDLSRAIIFILLIATLTYVSIPISVGTASDGASSSGTLTLNDLEGIWVRAKYIDSVRLNKSALSAEPEYLVFAHGSKLCCHNYHESKEETIIGVSETREKDVYQLQIMEPREQKRRAIRRVIKADSRRFKAEKDETGKIKNLIFLDEAIVSHKEEAYIPIAMRLDQYVIQFLLAGKYKDEKGFAYLFDKNGVAHWPDQYFTYKIGLDSTEVPCDYIMYYEEKPGKPTKKGLLAFFKWKNEKLLLFTRDSACDKEPFAVLTPESFCV